MSVVIVAVVLFLLLAVLIYANKQESKKLETLRTIFRNREKDIHNVFYLDKKRRKK